MTTARLELVLRVVGGLLAGIVVWVIGQSYLVAFLPALVNWSYLVNPLLTLLGLLSFVVAFALTPYLTTRPFFWLIDQVVHTPIGDIVAAAAGLSVGLLIGVLMAWPLSLLPFFGGFLPIVASLVLGYLGMTTMLSHKREVLQVLTLPGELIKARPGADRTSRAAAGSSQRVLVDTSAIIDGRIADIAETGFVPGTLVVTRFVLQELQHIADSADKMRRNRGRRGLDVLDRLQRQKRVPLEVLEAELEAGQDVDSQLVRMARANEGSILTNDYNLNRVAAIQGVNVLNVNDLANAVKSVVLPGEEMLLRIIQEGKEYGQGVGYLDDGTMVVVENGRRHVNSELEVVVLRVLQTAAGRMVFAQPKSSSVQSGQAVS